MKRLLTTELMAWKDRRNRKPLLLFGARQVGKSWLIENFGKENFRDVVKIDFMLDSNAITIFEPDLDPKRIISQVELRYGRRVDPQNTLLFLDEIQQAPKGITSLKYFCENAPKYHVAAAGSYMGLTLSRKGESFPVGKVDLLTLRPMNFKEFLAEIAGNPLVSALHSADIEALSQVSDKMEHYLKEYLVVGGMPEVVASYAQDRDLMEARRLQTGIVSDFDGDFSKHAPLKMLERMRAVWSSLPAQLARENKKFIYGAVRPGARARDFKESIQWLVDYGVVFKNTRVSALRVPLGSYKDISSFKLFCLDVGLLGAIARQNPQTILDGNKLFTEFKGALAEQYVAQELLQMGFEPLYWSAERGTAETDFAIEHDSSVLPIEVKAGENLKAKSLKVAREKFGLRRAVRTSLSPFRKSENLINIPLWAFVALPALL